MDIMQEALNIAEINFLSMNDEPKQFIVEAESTTGPENQDHSNADVMLVANIMLPGQDSDEVQPEQEGYGEVQEQSNMDPQLTEEDPLEGPSIVPCPQCNERFENRFQLTSHIQNKHTCTNGLQCYIRHKTFAEKYSLKRHIRVHESDPYEKKVREIIKVLPTLSNIFYR